MKKIILCLAALFDIQPGSNQVSIEQELNSVDNSMPEEMVQ